jgi:hypothetical protein
LSQKAASNREAKTKEGYEASSPLNLDATLRQYPQAILQSQKDGVKKPKGKRSQTKAK